MKAMLLMVACGASVITAAAQPLPFDPTPVRDVIQDGVGRIWAIGPEPGLLNWRAGRWRPRSLVLPSPDTNSVANADGLKGAFPILLQTNQLGVVHAVWAGPDRNDETASPHWITRIEGTNAPVSTVFDALLRTPFLTFEADGTGWLTEPGPDVYRIRPDLVVEQAFTIRSNQMSGTRFDQYNPVQTLPLADGGALFWGEQRFRELATLRGLVVASGTNFVHFPTIEGLPNRGFSVLERVEPGTLWMGVPYWDEAAGLYELELNGMRARKLAEPAPGAFSHVVGIHSTATDLFVISGGLWLRRAGFWQRIAFPLDSASFDDFYRVTRPVFTDAEGTWIGTGGNGLLRVSSSVESSATMFDWRMGQPLESVHRIARLPNGEMLLVGFGQGTTHTRPGDLLKGRSISPRVIDVWRAAGNLQRDADGHLWTLLTPVGEEASLGEWDGASWSHHPIPARVRQGDIGYRIGIDSLGRFWVPYRERLWIEDRQELRWTEKVALFAPAQSDWLHFDSLEDAFADMVRADPRGRLDLPGGSQPEFSARGEICFLGMDWHQRDRAVHYHDGQKWHRWDLASVGFVRPGYFGQPYFTPEGRLAINYTRGLRQHVTAEFEAGEWRSAPFRSAGARDPLEWMRSKNRIPGNTSRGEVTDGGGGSWRADGQQVIYSGPGLSVPQFDVAHVHPFIGARRIDQVWVDAVGNMVFGTSLGSRQYVVLAPPEALMPRPSVDLVGLTRDSVELRLGEGELAHPESNSPPDPDGSQRPRSGFSAVAIQEGLIILRWDGKGVLEVADQVEGPWTEVPTAMSPHTLEMTKPAEFYRIRR